MINEGRYSSIMWKSPKVRLMFKAVRGVIKEYFRESLPRRLSMRRTIPSFAPKGNGVVIWFQVWPPSGGLRYVIAGWSKSVLE